MNATVLATSSGWVTQLPAVNALLNLTATLLLVSGYILIRRGRPQIHKTAMLAAFATSIAFLTCYLIYHQQVGHVRFEGPTMIRYFYLAMLASHILLAAAVPVLAIATIYLALRGRWRQHRRIARWTFPIWLYVSVTGVLIYVVLYHVYPPGDGTAKLRNHHELASRQTLMEK